MLLGSKIAKRRKELGLSQTDLANGICTQATISKLELRNVAPLTDTLSAICVRLNFTLNDVMSEFTHDQTADTVTSMNEVKGLLAHYEFKNALTRFNQINADDIPAALKSRYHSLEGNILLVCNDDFGNAIFKYGVAAQESETEIDDLIVDAGIGTAYASQNDIDKAKYYFERVCSLTAEFEVKTEDLPDFLKALNNAGTFYSKIGNYHKSNELTQRLISALQLANTAPYLDQGFYRLAYNHFQLNPANVATVEQELNTAETIAKLFNNNILQKYIDDFRKNGDFTLNTSDAD